MGDFHFYFVISTGNPNYIRNKICRQSLWCYGFLSDKKDENQEYEEGAGMNTLQKFKLSYLQSVRSRLIALLIASIMIPTLIIGTLSYMSSKKALTESGLTDLTNIANSAYNMMFALNEQVESGKITKAEAQEQVRTLLVGPKNSDGTRDLTKSRIKVGTTGYVFAIDSKANEVMHPKLEGKNIWDAQGGIGKMIAETKNGVVEFKWINPGEKAARDKIAVLKYFEPWDWIISVGSYTEEFNGEANSIKYQLYILLAAEFVLGFVVAWFFGSRLIGPLQTIGHVMQQLGQGNLHNRLEFTERRDEYGRLAKHFNQALESLSLLIRKVADTSLQVASSSEQLTASAEQTGKATEQIAFTIQEMAVGSEKQVQSVEESVETVNDMSTGIQQISSTAQNVSGSAIHASNIASSGNEGIQTAIQQMNSINQTVNGLSEVVKGLGDRSQEISKIVEVITDIANQTNLLALNAAIEAARAGEHGRGFAVVADEVRKLAEQSAQSAQQISQLIASIQEETDKAVQSMGKATKEVVSGIGVVNVAGDSFEQIQKSVEEVAAQIQDVSAGIQHMAASADLVVKSIHTIAEVAETSAAGTQNVSAAAEEQLASMEEISASASALAKMAEELQTLVGQFKI